MVDIYSESKHPGVNEIYRDDVLWVLDKAAGVLSHPNPPSKAAPNSLLRCTYDHDRELYRVATEGRAQAQVHLVHRLDQETSGLILCTFDLDAAGRMREQLYHGEIKKEYRALVVGIPHRPRGEWHDRLEKSAQQGRVSVKVLPGRENALTEFAVVESLQLSGTSLLALFPHTGRTHQLRVQSAARKLPIAGDERYGDFTANRFLRDEVGLKHMFLHAYRIELRHPSSGHLMRFEAPLSSRLTQPLERLRTLRRRPPRDLGRDEGQSKDKKRARGRRGRRR